MPVFLKICCIILIVGILKRELSEFKGFPVEQRVINTPVNMPQEICKKIEKAERSAWYKKLMCFIGSGK